MSVRMFKSPVLRSVSRNVRTKYSAVFNKAWRARRTRTVRHHNGYPAPCMDLRKQGTGTFYPVRYPYPKWNSIEIFHEKNKEKDNDCFITTPQKKKKETALNRSGNCNNILTFYLEIPVQKKAEGHDHRRYFVRFDWPSLSLEQDFRVEALPREMRD